MDDLLAHLTVALADRYTVERELGCGGMAVVFLAHDRKLGRDVALKVVRPEFASALGSARFLREAAIAARFTIIEPFLYALHESYIQLVRNHDPVNPSLWSTVDVG